MCGPTFKSEYNRVHSISAPAISGSQYTTAVVIDNRIHIFKQTGPHHIWPTDQGFFRRRAKNFDRARQFIFDNGFFNRYSCCGSSRTHGIMPAAVSGSTLYYRRLMRNSSLLRDHGQSVKFAQDTDNRFSGTVRSDKTRRHPGRLSLYRETGFFQSVGQKLGRLEFLHPQFSKRPDRV